MLSNLPLLIGLRYTRAKRRNQFISFISAFSLLGMALGVMALIVVLSVMNGFDREMKQRILSVVPHGYVDQTPAVNDWQSLAARVLEHPRVLAAAPYIESMVMLTYGGRIEAAQLQAIEPAAESKVSVVDSTMLVGRLDYLQPGEYGIVMGRLLASRMQLAPGDKVRVTSPEINMTPLGAFTRSRSFTLIGVFEAGAQIDASLVMIHIDDAKTFFRVPGIQGLHVKTNDMFAAPRILSELGQTLGGGISVKDWSQTQGSLFQAVKMEKLVVGTMLMVIIAVAAFNLVSSLVLMVADKRADIAVLRTLGLSSRQVMQIFMVQGVAVGAAGIVIGALLGCLLAYFVGPLVTGLERLVGLQVFDPDIYFITQLPSHLLLSDVALVCAVALVLSVLATLYPAYRASTIEPAEALRYE